MNFIDVLKKIGYETIQADFYTKIDDWNQWYQGNVKKFHTYRVYNGSGGYIRQRRFSAGMAKKVAEDWANLLLNEKVKITLEGEKEQEFVDDVLEANNFEVKGNEAQEKKSALGTVAYVFNIAGVPVDEETGEITGAGGEIKLDYVTAGHIFPLSWDNGRGTECAFFIERTVKGDKYMYCQIHHREEDGMYTIINRLFKSNSNDLSEVDLADVAGFESVSPEIRTDSTEPMFIIDKLNIANNYADDNPMGISVYANAIDQLKGVDVAYDSYVNEFILGKKRVMVKPSALKDMDSGNLAFDPNDVTFYLMPEDSQDDSVIHEIDMALRTQDHKTGIQDMLNMLSAKCGFGESHYKFENGSIATATQIISENSTLFRTIKKHEIILEAVLIELCRTILRLGNQYMNAGLNEEVEISIDFDDSIIEDKATEFQRDLQMLSAGIIQPYEFRMKWMNEDEATAKKALPKMTQLIQDEMGADEV